MVSLQDSWLACLSSVPSPSFGNSKIFIYGKYLLHIVSGPANHSILTTKVVMLPKLANLSWEV